MTAQESAPPVTEQAKPRIDPIFGLMISLLKDGDHWSFLDFTDSASANEIWGTEIALLVRL